MANYKDVLRSFQNYFLKKAISRNASKKNDFLSLEIDKLYAKIEANDLIIEENQYSQSDVHSLTEDSQTILMDRSISSIKKNKINQYLREISNR